MCASGPPRPPHARVLQERRAPCRGACRASRWRSARRRSAPRSARRLKTAPTRARVGEKEQADARAQRKRKEHSSAEKRLAIRRASVCMRRLVRALLALE
eukprot:3399145-Pleurochrysis_carterae.AAC.1